MTPLTVLVNLLAVALGLLAGFTVMGAITPDLPSPETAPAVFVEDGEPVRPSDPESLFNPGRFAQALASLEEQWNGSGIAGLRVAAGEASVAAGPDEEGPIDLGAIPADELQRVVALLERERPGLTIDDIGHFDLLPDPEGGLTWYVQLDSGTTQLGPPWTYSVPLGGDRVEVGKAAPGPEAGEG